MSDKIVIPDAAIEDFNRRYAKYLPKPKSRPMLVDEDELYLKHFCNHSTTKETYEN